MTRRSWASMTKKRAVIPGFVLLLGFVLLVASAGCAPDPAEQDQPERDQAKQDLAERDQAEQDLAFEGSVAELEASKSCPFSTEKNPDGTTNFESTSLDSGALDGNAIWELQDRPGHPGNGETIARWNISLQRFGDDCIIQGIGIAGADPENAAEARRHIDRGLEIFEWGLDRQSPDGSFIDSVENMEGSDSEVLASLEHNTSFFVAHASRSLYLLEQFVQANPEYAPRYAPVIDDYKARLKKAAESMADRPAMAADDPFNHRFFLEAAALGMAAKLNGLDPQDDLMQEARYKLKEAMKRQIGSSSNPSSFIEDHGAFQEDYRLDKAGRIVGPGTDTGYHSNSIVYAQWWLMYFPNDDINRELRGKVDKGVDWLVSRIKSNGFITVDRNTRACADEVNDFGSTKAPHYRATVRAFVVWHELDDAPGTVDLYDLAKTVDDYRRTHDDLCARQPVT